jgi:uncharacterized membrane protein YdjX (TVP38/TMEM64 family)|eukprot:jgi/Chrpa1/22786/Chrysochromulina_OHIO_Genome00028120-RA
MRLLVTLSVCLLSAAAGYVTAGGPLFDSCRDCRASAEQRQRQQLRWLRGKVSLTQAGQADEEKPLGTAVAAGALASSALILEGVQFSGTAALFYFGQQWTGTSNPAEEVRFMIEYFQGLGTEGYFAFAAATIFLQVVPVAAAFILTVSAGAIFGAVKGTATVLTCSTMSATISFFLARNLGRAGLLEATKESKQFQALDKAFGSAGFGTSLTLITLLRLSPVLPFAWANYVFGLSPVPAAAFSVGTLLGSFPAVAAYVSAGSVGADVVINGADFDPVLLGVGVAATLGAITFAGKIATDALKDLDVDLDA